MGQAVWTLIFTGGFWSWEDHARDSFTLTVDHQAVFTVSYGIDANSQLGNQVVIAAKANR